MISGINYGNQQVNFTSGKRELLTRTIKWEKAVTMPKNKSTQPDREWKKAIEEYKSAKYKRFYFLSNIAKKMGTRFDGSVQNLINAVFMAFESGKISIEQCMKKIEKINRTDFEYNMASNKLESMRLQNQANYMERIKLLILSGNIEGLKKHLAN